MNSTECQVPKMQRKERVLSSCEAADHVDVAAPGVEDLRVEVIITMDVKEEEEDEDETNIKDLLLNVLVSS